MWILTEESTILIIQVSLLEKQWFFSFKETIWGQAFITRQLVAQPVGSCSTRVVRRMWYSPCSVFLESDLVFLFYKEKLFFFPSL